jgi:signal transduction histidine kinase/ligand-binding sensor domain-containing protein/DNA-binding response OmpR family regulator
MANKVHIAPLLLIFSFLFLPNLSFPQNDEITFKHLSVEDGLSNSSVFAILQDSRGFMWFGTANGLNRYNGYNIRIFNHDSQDPSTLSNSFILALYEDSRGILWVGTQNGLNKFNRESENFTQYTICDDSIGSNEQIGIKQIIEDNSGVLWLASNYGLYRLNVVTGQVKRFIPKPEDPKPAFNENYVLSVCEIEKDRLLLGTGEGLISFITGKSEFTKIAFDDPFVDSHPSTWKVYKDRLGTLWLGMESRGLVQYNIENGEFDKYILDPEDPSSLSSNIILTIHEDQSGILWTGTGSGGLNKFNRDTKCFTSYKHNSRDDGSICSSSIQEIYEDKDGNIWLGSTDNGISMISKWGKSFKHYVHDTEDSSSLGYGEVMAICEARSGDLWVAQWGSGVSRLISGSNIFIHYTNNPSTKISISRNFVNDICEDRAGNIWVGSWGLDCIDPVKNKVIHYQNNTDNNSNGGFIVFEIYEDRQGIIWFCTMDGGLSRFDRKNGIFKHFKNDPLDSMSLSDDHVLSIYQDSKNILWVGTVNGLCKMVQLENGKEGFVCFKNNPLNPASLSNNIIFDVFEDSEQRLWIGTNYGLNLFDDKNESFISYTKEDGLPDNGIGLILEDDYKNLWLATESGLAKFNPSTNIFKIYDERDGLKYCRMVQSGYKAFHKGRTGKFYCGFMNSLAVFHPNSLKDNPNPPQIVLTDFKLNNKPVEIGDNSYLKKSITETKAIELPYYENILSFEFSALDYTAPGKNQYAYKMEGIDDDWVYTDADRRYVSYTNLDPGNYIFTVKGTNCDGVWNEEGVSISIIINPPWWATTWAYIIYAVILTSILYFTWKLQLKRIRIKRDYEMSKFEAEKMHEVDELKSRFFANISHEFRTPLTLILGLAKKIVEKSKEQTLTEDASVIRRNAKRLNGLVNQLLDLSKIESGKMTLQTSPINLIPFLKGLVLSFVSFAERKRITLKFNSDEEEVVAYVDKDKIEKIITNLLSNAFKFTPEGGSIEFSVRRAFSTGNGHSELIEGHPEFISGSASVLKSKNEFKKLKRVQLDKEGFVEISVSDTGIGISPERIDKIFDRFFQVDSSHTREQEGTGLGLALTKEIVELHKGKISVASSEGKGSTFTVTIPLGKEHLKPEEIIEGTIETEEIIPKEVEVFSEYEIEKVSSNIEIITEEGKLLLLIVEDNTDVRNYIKGSLEKEFRILEAINGEDGLNQAIKHIPDLIISDVMMPKMDGFQMCDRIKNDEKTSHIPVIMLTAKATSKDKIEGYETGADDYIMKPFDAEVLRIRINNLIQQRKRLREYFSKEGIFETNDIVVTSTDKTFLKKALDIINKHISDETFSVDVFADEIAMSRFQLRRKLLALVGESPSDLIRRIRLTKAAILLEQNFGNISEIAAEVGFNNPANFAHSFKVHFGVSPSEYLNSKKV